MRYFTEKQAERDMMQMPKSCREDVLPDPPDGHVCHGCGRYGESCVLPCYRNVQLQRL